MPSYEHICKACDYEWVDIYSMSQDPPSVCPNCEKEGDVMRLISKPGKVTVELQGRELVEKLWKEGKDLARRAKKDENLAANLYGKK